MNKQLTKLLSLIILSSIAFTSLSYADSMEMGESVHPTTPENKDNTKTYLRVGGLCMGGAVVGSIVPIIGNITGCAVGAIVGYFWPPDNKPSTKTQEIVLDQ